MENIKTQSHVGNVNIDKKRLFFSSLCFKVHRKYNVITSFLPRYVNVIISLLWELGPDRAEQLNFSGNEFTVKLKDID